MLKKIKGFFRFKDYITTFFLMYLRERKLRRSAIVRSEKRIAKQHKHLMKSITLMKEIIEIQSNKWEKDLSTINSQYKNLLNREAIIEGLTSQVRKTIAVLDNYAGRFEYIEGLAQAPEKEFKKFTKKLQSIVDDVDFAQQIPRRLASVETRITNLEIKNGG